MRFPRELRATMAILLVICFSIGVSFTAAIKVSGSYASMSTLPFESSVVTPDDELEDSTQADVSLAPGRDGELAEGSEDVEVIEEDFVDEPGEVGGAGSDESQGGDEGGSSDSGTGGDVTPPSSGPDESGEPVGTDDDGQETGDSDEDQGDGPVDAPKPPPVEGVGLVEESAGDDTEGPGSDPVQQDDEKPESGDTKDDPKDQPEDVLEKKPLTPVEPRPEPTNVVPPLQPIQEIQPGDLPGRGGVTEDDFTTPTPTPTPEPTPVQPDPQPTVEPELPTVEPTPVDDGGTDETPPPVTGPDEVDEEEPEPVVVCPVEVAVRFNVEEIDLAEDGEALRVTAALPDDLPEDFEVGDVAELTALVKLGPELYGARTVKALPVAGFGAGTFRISSDDLVYLLDEHRGEVTLEVRGELNECSFAGTEKLLVTETVIEDEPEPVVEDVDDPPVEDADEVQESEVDEVPAEGKPVEDEGGPEVVLEESSDDGVARDEDEVDAGEGVPADGDD